jgi:hypothetical protein
MGISYSTTGTSADSRTESFQPSAQIPREITVMNRNDAAEALQEAEEFDEYRAACERCQMNKAARRLMDYSTREPISDVQYYMLRLAEAMPAWLKRTLPHNIRVAMLAPSADGGMPHTRHGNIICFPQYFPFDGRTAQTTVNHEMIHIHQRAHPVIWDAIYKRIWQFTRFTGTIPDELLPRIRLNPDTILTPLYVWRNTWMPLPVFTRPESPMIGAMKLIWYNVRTGEWQQVTPPEFVDEFGQLADAEAEHPHELAAYWLSEPAGAGPVSNARKLLEEAVENLG